MKRQLMALGALIVICSSACGPAAVPAATTSPLQKPVEALEDSAEDTAMEVETNEGVESLEDLAVSLCLRELAGQLQVAEEQIQVVSVEPMNWPDASLGCPEPGKMYAQVIVPGFRVLLEAGDAGYLYHTDGQRAISCQEP